MSRNKRGLLQPGQERFVPALSLRQLLPKTEYYITYEGSATMPACQETATWILLNRPLYITEQQVCSLFITRVNDRINCDVFRYSCTRWEGWSRVIPINRWWRRLQRWPLWSPIRWATITGPYNRLTIGQFAPILILRRPRWVDLQSPKPHIFSQIIDSLLVTLK